MYHGVYLLLFILLTMGNGYSQSSIDSSASGYARVKEIYFRTLGLELNLYNGVFYKGFAQHNNDEGQPYFKSDFLVDGYINYEGVHYEHIPIMYDLVDDKVIIDHPFSNHKFQLISEKLNSFGFNNHSFVYLSSSKLNYLPQDGFYERLYNGRFKAYAKWHKEKFETVRTAGVQVSYEDKNKFYIFNGKQFIRVKSKASVLNALKDKKQALSKFIRKERLIFGDNCAESLPKVLAFYESGS